MAAFFVIQPRVCIAGKWAWQVATARDFSTIYGPLTRGSLQHTCKGHSALQCDISIQFLKPKLLGNLRHFCAGPKTSVPRTSKHGRNTKYIQDKWKLLLNKGQIIRWTTTNNGNGKQVAKALPKSSDIKRLLSIAEPEKWKIAG